LSSRRSPLGRITFVLALYAIRFMLNLLRARGQRRQSHPHARLSFGPIRPSQRSFGHLRNTLNDRRRRSLGLRLLQTPQR
jgi:hypothetical protein